MIELHPPSDGILHAVGVRLTAQLAPIGAQEVTVTYETYLNEESGWERAEGLVAITCTKQRMMLRATHCLDYLRHPSPADRERGAAEWIGMFTSVLAPKLVTLFEIANSAELRR